MAKNKGGRVKWIKRVKIREGIKDKKKLAVLANILKKLFHHGKRDRQVRTFILKLLTHNNIRAKDHVNEIKCMMQWVQNDNNIRYTFDPCNVEYFQTARRMLWDWRDGVMSKGRKSLAGGDCDDKSIFMASLLGAIGYHSYILLVDSKGDGVYSHAMAGVKLPKPYAPYGNRIVPVELTKVVELGWHTPKATKVFVIDMEKKGTGFEKYIGYVSEDLY